MTEPFGPVGPAGPADTSLSPEPVSQFEPTSEAVPTAAVEVLAADGSVNAPIANPGRRRLRWAIAAVATIVVVAGSTLGFAVLSAARSSSQVLPWAPADAIVYAEVRADLPGDQRANLLAFLSKFPGFADQTSFDAKTDDGLNRLVKRMTNDNHDFSTEIKPWFGGQMGVSIDAANPASPGVLVVISVRDATAASAWLKSVAPADATHETVGGIDLIEPAGFGGKPTAAFAIDASVILAGTPDAVKAAIKRGPSGVLAGNPGFKAAAGTLGGDDLGIVYVDLKGYLNLIMAAETRILSQVGSQVGGAEASPLGAMPSLPAMSTAFLPGWLALRVRAEADHLVVDEAEPTVAVPGQTAELNRVGSLAASLPANTVAKYEMHDLGSFIQGKLVQLEAMPGGITAAQVDQVAKYLGGIDKAFGWMGDTDALVLHDAAGFSGGLVAQTRDATASGNLVTEIRNLVTLSGGQGGITVSSETYAGQTITLLDGDFSQIGGSTTFAVGPSFSKFQVAITQTKDLVIVGVGDAFVKSVLDTKAGSSLADQPAYQRATNLAGTSNIASAYLDLTALRTSLEALGAGSAALGTYDSEIKSFLVPIQSLAWSDQVGTAVSTSQVVLVLK